MRYARVRDLKLDSRHASRFYATQQQRWKITAELHQNDQIKIIRDELMKGFLCLKPLLEGKTTLSCLFSVCCELLYSVALWHGDQAALYRAITARRAAANVHGSPDRKLGTSLVFFCVCGIKSLKKAKSLMAYLNVALLS